jgi:hypothetical protein
MHEVWTCTSAGPPEPPLGTMAVHVVLLEQLTLVARFEVPNPPCVMKVKYVVPTPDVTKFVPVIVTVWVPPAAGPLAGTIDETVGVAGAVPHVKKELATPPGV